MFKRGPALLQYLARDLQRFLGFRFGLHIALASKIRPLLFEFALPGALLLAAGEGAADFCARSLRLVERHGGDEVTRLGYESRRLGVCFFGYGGFSIMDRLGGAL